MGGKSEETYAFFRFLGAGHIELMKLLLGKGFMSSLRVMLVHPLFGLLAMDSSRQSNFCSDLSVIQGNTPEYGESKQQTV